MVQFYVDQALPKDLSRDVFWITFVNVMSLTMTVTYVNFVVMVDFNML